MTRAVASELRHASYAGNSAKITDPNTGGWIVLRGVTKAALKAHPKDLTEPLRVSRKLQLLTGWSDDEANPTVFP